MCFKHFVYLVMVMWSDSWKIPTRLEIPESLDPRFFYTYSSSTRIINTGEFVQLSLWRLHGSLISSSLFITFAQYSCWSNQIGRCRLRVKSSLTRGRQTAPRLLFGFLSLGQYVWHLRSLLTTSDLDILPPPNFMASHINQKYILKKK